MQTDRRKIAYIEYAIWIEDRNMTILHGAVEKALHSEEVTDEEETFLQELLDAIERRDL